MFIETKHSNSKTRTVTQLVLNDQFEEKDPGASIGTRSGGLLMKCELPN